MFANATLLSIIYLLIGILVEVLRRVYPADWVMRAVLAIDSLPARTLELLGAMSRLRTAYAYGKVDEIALRLVFSATTIVIIFLMAAIVGVGMWLMRRFLYRRYLDV